MVQFCQYTQECCTYTVQVPFRKLPSLIYRYSRILNSTQILLRQHRGASNPSAGCAAINKSVFLQEGIHTSSLILVEYLPNKIQNRSEFKLPPQMFEGVGEVVWVSSLFAQGYGKYQFQTVSFQ